MDTKTETIDVLMPRQGGGQEAVQLRLPPIMRRYALISLMSEAAGEGEEIGDPYMMQCFFFAAVGMSWVGDLPGAPRRLPTDLVEAAEVVGDALHAMGIDIMSEGFVEAASQVSNWIVASITDDETEEAQAASDAADLFPEGAAAGSMSDVPSSAS